MICAQFYPGQGLGNQLWLYAALRTLAQKKGLDFGIANPQYFKGLHFINLDFGSPIQLPPNSDPNNPYVLPINFKTIFFEHKEIEKETGLDVSIYDPRINDIEDWTKIEGNFQDPKYLCGKKDEIRTWFDSSGNNEILKFLEEDTCIVNFRGGEYRHLNQVFLKKGYWRAARRYMKQQNPDMKFLIVTDDVGLASYFFPQDEILNCDMQDDYLLLLNARYLILSNSSFCWFPAWLNQSVQVCVAPLYWWGNTIDKFWACGNTISNDWIYLSKTGRIEGGRELSAGSQVRLKWYDKGLILFLTSLFRGNWRMALGQCGFLPSRRRSRSLIWLSIILNKLIPHQVSNAIYNRVYEFKKNLVFSKNERPILTHLWRRESKDDIIDAFYINDELDLAELRMEILFPHVKKFVVLESTHTFTGKKKNLHFQENLWRFSRFMSKVELLTLDLPIFTRQDFIMALYQRDTSLQLRRIISAALIDPNVPLGESQWLREFLNKEYISVAFHDLPPNSRVVVSDVDEIWNPKRPPTKYPDSEILVYKLQPYVYYLNLHSNESWQNWSGSVSATVREVKRRGVANIRVHRRVYRRVILKGGWHFSFQGGVAKILSKLDSYGHQELNTKINRERLLGNSNLDFDLRGIGATFKVDETRLPPEVLRLKHERPELFVTISTIEKS